VVVVMAVVVVMMVMVVVVMMMVVMHWMFHRSGGRRGFLRDGVTGEADREAGGDEKALDHGKLSFDSRTPRGSSDQQCLPPPELKMNQMGKGPALVRVEQGVVHNPARCGRARFDRKIRTFKRWP
jgi:hypothetical protein